MTSDGTGSEIDIENDTGRGTGLQIKLGNGTGDGTDLQTGVGKWGRRWDRVTNR